MALQKVYERFGVTFNNAYHKVEDVRVSKDSVRVRVHIQPDANTQESIGVYMCEFDYDANGGEPLTQAYNYLKTLPEYAGATDV